MITDPIYSISPIDGRYQSKTEKLGKYFSEFGLMKYRTQVEIEYFIALNTFLGNDFNEDTKSSLRLIYKSFKASDCHRIKEIESQTNHDVKAVEYFIREQFTGSAVESFIERVHFGLTSQDINNSAIPMLLKDAILNEIYPSLQKLSLQLHTLGSKWSDIAMLARTHGQPASPTRLGKEISVFSERLYTQLQYLQNSIDLLTVKFGGATGNLNAHHVAYPTKDWSDFADTFAKEQLGLSRSLFTTQINHYDELATIFDAWRRVNVILIDLCRDFWTYVSMDYFKQRVVASEVGSSAMPHKVNPIDFENAEGNFGLANALFDYMSNKLPVSRLQRDLTDSTVLRNIGVPFSHTLIALQSLSKGLGKLELNQDKINQDLENNWAVVAEGIQTVLRRENYPNPYEALKQFSRGKNALNKSDFEEFIDSLHISDGIKAELKSITPFNYTGIKMSSDERFQFPEKLL